MLGVELLGCQELAGAVVDGVKEGDDIGALGYQQARKGCVPSEAVQQVHGDDVCKAPHLVDHRVCVRHGTAVLQRRWQSRASHGEVDLLLHAGLNFRVLHECQEGVAQRGAHRLGAAKEQVMCGHQQGIHVEVAQWVLLPSAVLVRKQSMKSRGDLGSREACWSWTLWAMRSLRRLKF